MDDTEDDARYPPTTSYFHNQSYPSHRPKLPVRNPSIAPPISEQYAEDQEQEEDDDDDEEQFVNRQNNHFDDEEDDDDEEEEEEENQVGNEEDDEDEEEEEEEGGNDYLKINKKKRRLDNLALGYEFAPRVKVPPSTSAPSSKPSFGGSRNSPADWSEQSTFVLLDAWGDRFLQLGRKSLRSDEWLEVAKRVSQASKTLRTETQCRNRLDTLKKKYKKEKIRMAETGSSVSKWGYFKKMDTLMTAPPRQSGLSCGLDSGEYVFMNPRVYLNRSNGMDEMRDSPGNSELSEGGGEDEDDDSEGLPPSKKVKFGKSGDSSFRMLADSVKKFGEIYEKIENSKKQQMMELERMRMEFHRDLEIQKRQMLERAQEEIAKIRQGDDEEVDASSG